MPGSKISLSDYYDRSKEGERLNTGMGALEFERSRIILQRFLPPAPAMILDVGGGTGPYSRWLTERGYQVYLVELSLNLLTQAAAASGQSERQIFSSIRANALALPFPGQFADAVLLFGPLYHLTEKEARKRALSEARRVLKSEGILFAAAISRFASAIDGLSHNFIADSVFYDIIRQDLRTGQHYNPTDEMSYFTDAYFHLPEEFQQEITEAGFADIQILPVEGIAVFSANFAEMWQEPHRRMQLLELIASTEHEKSLLGCSPHWIAIARR